MSVKENVIRRFAGPEDLEWCVVEDRHLAKRQIRNKIVSDEILIAELDVQIIGHVRLEFLWSTKRYIGLVFVVDQYWNEGVYRKMRNLA
jgi:hypothetical protein